jgi:hypothetical protein
LSYLLDKSQTNLEAAHVLHQIHKYAAVPHCAYYSCLQRIKYELYIRYHYYCDDNSSEVKGKSSHNVIWEKFMQQIEASQLLTDVELLELRNQFGKLKLNRIISDYNHHDQSTPTLSDESLSLAHQLMDLLNNIFRT